MRAVTPAAVLVTSGLGNQFGGIGVVSAQMLAAMREVFGHVAVWRNHLAEKRWRRVGRLAARAILGSRPQLVVYEHVDLARLSILSPWQPYAVFLHGTEAWRPLSGIRRLALRRATRLYANSHFTARAVRQANPWVGEIEVVWLGVPAQPSVQPDGRGATALIVGRMDAAERGKGHDLILDAWPLVREHVPSATLRIVGEGDDRGRLESRARAERLDGIRFDGRLSDAARDRAYAESSLFVLPSVQEGFGLVAVEAALHGCAICGLKGTVIEELFPKDAVLLDRLDAGELARVVASALSDPKQLTARGVECQRRARAEFTEERFRSRFVAALRRLVASGGA